MPWESTHLGYMKPWDILIDDHPDHPSIWIYHPVQLFLPNKRGWRSKMKCQATWFSRYSMCGLPWRQENKKNTNFWTKAKCEDNRSTPRPPACCVQHPMPSTSLECHTIHQETHASLSHPSWSPVATTAIGPYPYPALSHPMKYWPYPWNALQFPRSTR